MYICVPEALTVLFILSSFIFFFFEYVWGFAYLFMLKNIPAFILCCFSDWKNCIWRSSLTLCSKEKTRWLSVLLLASECGPLFYLLINLQFYFLSSMSEVRDSYRGFPWGSGGGQPSQRDSELCVFKKRSTGRQVHVFPVLVCVLDIVLC